MGFKSTIAMFIIAHTLFFTLILLGMHGMAQYNPAAVKAGIEATVNGPGSNYINKPFSYDFGNTTRAR